MVVLDAFFLSHTYEPVDVPDAKEVDRFLPSYKPKFELDSENPCAFGSFVPPAFYMEMRHEMSRAMDEARDRFDRIDDAYARIFKRRYGAVEAVQCDDADIVFVTSGTVTSTCRLVLRSLRKRGEKVGILKIKLFRPSPVDKIRAALKSAKKVAVVDRNCSFGAGGIFAQEVRAALCNVPDHPLVFGYIAGIGGRDVTPELLEEIYWKTKQSRSPENEAVWIS
jgi:pyruvate ferredoxin oxidoreductase alpha subunit